MNESGSSRRSAVYALAGALALCACGGQGRPDHPPPEQAGVYLPPPTVSGAERTGDGAVRLAGHGPADALVRLRSPDGGGATALAGGDGRWTLTLPASDAPRLYALQAELPGRVVRGEGAIAVLPPPAVPALTLRAGFAGAPAGQGQPGRLRLVTFDFDGGGAAVGGFAPPRARVRLSVDGGTVGVTNADAEGRFAVLAVVRNVAAGPHRIRVDTPQGLSIEQTVEVADAVLPADQAFAAARAPGGWRISWQLPGGGAQSSLVFEDAVASAAGGAAPRIPGR